MKPSPRVLSSTAVIAIAAFGLTACTNTPLYDRGVQPVGSGYPASQNYAQWGRVTNVELVRGEPSSGTVGTVAGGVVGGLAGSQIGGGTGRTAATVAGAIGGALIGRAIEQNTRQPSPGFYRVTVRMENDTVRTFDYAEQPDVRIGERVRVDGNQVYR